MEKQDKILLFGWGIVLLATFIAFVMICTENEIKSLRVASHASMGVSDTIYRGKVVQKPSFASETVSIQEKLTFPTVEREITAYNTVEEQCDSTPCISADGSNICERLANGERLVASNAYEFGTKLRIEGLGDFIVVDRMNRRFPDRIDIAMSADEIPQAIAFGKKIRKVSVIE